MDKMFFYKNYRFMHYRLSRFHHRDNRSGAPMHFLAYMIKGRCECVSKDKTICATEGELFYIPYGLSYQSFWYGDTDIDFLSFGFLHLPHDDDLGFELQKLPCSEEMKERLLAISTERMVSCETLGRFYGVMAELMPKMERRRTGREEQIVERAKEYIAAHSHAAAAQIAEFCAVSEPYLYRLFKKHTGTTPNEYKQFMLCELATHLLTSTDRSIELISAGLGFSSAAYFRKIYKKHTGKTPREMRKSRLM